MKDYFSPRWSGEICDCSMPMTIDTYSHCSYRCLYCFAFFQQSHSMTAQGLGAVKPERIKKLFLTPDDPTISKGWKQFVPLIKQKKVLQWGGMSDPFDEYEREFGRTLELLEIFRDVQYPIRFSTKGAWWTEDSRYTELFKECKDFWAVMFSIISNDESKVKAVEIKCPSTAERFAAMRRMSDLGVMTILRLRPFVIGMSSPDHVKLIERAADAGAQAVSTEFFCCEGRADSRLQARYKAMSVQVGYDLLPMYRKFSSGNGYLRLNRKVKEKYIDEMENACQRLGLRFAVSDAHFKERSCTGSCCGLPEDWNWCRGQFTNALLVAKKNGSVRWSDIAGDLEYAKEFKWTSASGFNTTSAILRAKLLLFTMFDYIHWVWNTPSNGKSPFKYFGGVLVPDGVDENGDLVYRFSIR